MSDAAVGQIAAHYRAEAKRWERDARKAQDRLASLESKIEHMAETYDGRGEATMSAWVSRDLRAMLEKKCLTPDCPGDYRYFPPGRGHRDGCAEYLMGPDRD